MWGRSYLLLLAALAVIGAACQDRAEPVVFGPLSAEPEMEARLDRQWIPRARAFPFEAAGSIEGRWSGTLFDPETGREGSFLVETISFERRGETVHLVQTWWLFLPELINEWSVADPVRLPVTGILNLASGRLVLNGTVTDAIISQAHVSGTAVIGEGGVLSAGGELMFNPQPEPSADL